MENAQSLQHSSHSHVTKDIHLKSPKIDESIEKSIADLHALLQDEVLYIEYKTWCTDEMLHRFLIARHFRVQDSYELLMSALKWRSSRIPSKGVVELSGDIEWEHKLEKESVTGKIFVADSLDKHGRPIIIMDGHAQNTSCVDGQQTFLAWNLELACSLMPSHVDKYVAWFYLDRFSIFNSPSMANTRETLFMLSSCYPERLGHLVVFMPTLLLHTVFAAVKYLMDAKTISKIVFISGKLRLLV